MPRHCLPDFCKHVRTMEVLLTKTTEDDIWEHFVEHLKNYEEMADEYLNLQHKGIRFLRDGDPYQNVNWKAYLYGSGSLHDTRCYLKKTQWWLNDDEEGTKRERYYKVLTQMPEDVRRTMELWKDDEKKAEISSTWLYQADKFRSNNRCNYDEMDHYEEIAWNRSMQKWKSENKDYIARKTLERDHQAHKTMEDQQTRHDNLMKYDKFYATSSWATNWKLIDYTLTCSICKMKADEDRERAIRIAEREAEQKRRDEEWLLQKQTQAEPVVVAPRVKQHCDLCDASYYNKSDHEASKVHIDKQKMAQLFCSKCNHRSRCKAEHEGHLVSKKHIGSEKPTVVLRCEACDYTAVLKQHLDQHNRSKKHLAMVQSI